MATKRHLNNKAVSAPAFRISHLLVRDNQVNLFGVVWNDRSDVIYEISSYE